MSEPTPQPWAPKCIIFELGLLVNNPKDNPAPPTAADDNDENKDPAKESECPPDTSDDSPSTIPIPIPGADLDDGNIVRGWAGVQGIPTPSPSAQGLLQRVQQKGIRVGLVRDHSEVETVVDALDVSPSQILFVGSATLGNLPAAPVVRGETMRAAWVRPEAAKRVAVPLGRGSSLWGVLGAVEDAIKRYL
ncbi:hypothetical protein E4U22_003223 [Claviceps purpurea]|nr:hypothetical protein E4U38_001662 [Claviceps purpurea]KAG6169705.1 hypothetical protein E4U51_001430 [Claviceps purpurea]KAG6288842.1 hypothetical protein E4U46_002977 [Claviceps purpurea]KAG6320483.1 hypothetical protein E4U22_003223 [Claviceps purpurea]